MKFADSDVFIEELFISHNRDSDFDQACARLQELQSSYSTDNGWTELSASVIFVSPGYFPMVKFLAKKT